MCESGKSNSTPCHKYNRVAKLWSSSLIKTFTRHRITNICTELLVFRTFPSQFYGVGDFISILQERKSNRKVVKIFARIARRQCLYVSL